RSHRAWREGRQAAKGSLTARAALARELVEPVPERGDLGERPARPVDPAGPRAARSALDLLDDAREGVLQLGARPLAEPARRVEVADQALDHALQLVVARRGQPLVLVPQLGGHPAALLAELRLSGLQRVEDGLGG